MSDAASEEAPTDHPTERTRTVTWEDPAPGVARMPAMTGLEYLRSMIRGELPPPPIAELMRMTLVAADPGTATFVCEPSVI